MLERLRKADKSGAAPANWRPDFRDRTRLPDVKVVRTSFFVNTSSIVILVAIALFFGQQELRRSTLNSEIKGWEQTIRENSSANREALRRHRQFNELTGRVDEIYSFLSVPVTPTDLFLFLGRSLPPSTSLVNVRYDNWTQDGETKGKQIVLNGNITGSPEQGSSIAGEYLNAIREAEVFRDVLADVSLTSLVRGAEADLVSFSITIRLNNPEIQP